MKLSSNDKALLFFAAGLFALAVLNFKQGRNTPGVCWLIGAFGCAVMFYAAHYGMSRKG